MRIPTICAALMLVAPAVPAAPLALPVRHPGDGGPTPYYCAELVELRLAPPASRALTARRPGPTLAGASLRIGLSSVDAAAASLGGAIFEPEFAGELAPSPDDPGAIDFTAYWLVHLAPGTPLETALDRFGAAAEVTRALPVAMVRVSAAPDDSLFTQQPWLLQASSPRHDIRATEAWNVTSGDSGVVVAILDTGVLPYHPDLGGVLAGGHGNLWVNWAELGGVPGIDDDHNGFVDDWGGWDFVNSVPPGAQSAGEDGVDPDNDPNDFSGHGTAVAGLVAALANNGIGIAGVAPGVRVMPLRIAWMPAGFGLLSGDLDMATAAQAIRYATRMGASVLNCSWDSYSDPASGFDSTVTAATRAGVVIVNAAGNNNTPLLYLAKRPDVISVAATDTNDAVWPGTVLGSWVDLAADGVGLVSTGLRRVNADSTGMRTPAYFTGLTGTSFATPQATAAVALVQSLRREQGLKPLSPQGVLLRLRETADDISAANGGAFAGLYGTGRLNVLRALTDRPTSTATRGRAYTVGPPVVLRYNTGVVRVVYATSDRHLVALDGMSADTVWTAPLTGVPLGNPAAADFGASRGIGVFVGTSAGRVEGVRDDGAPWPAAFPARAATEAMSAGVAIGDLDLDGVPEIVCASRSGRLYAWRYDGTAMPGFPVSLGSPGLTLPAVAHFADRPGEDIVLADGLGALHRIGADGLEPAGWPAACPADARAPVVATLGTQGTPPAVVVAATGSIAAYEADGSVRWSRPLAGSLVADPIVADLDGDGATEIVLALSGPATIALIDSAGLPIARGAWPLTPASLPVGPMVAGPLRAGAKGCLGFATSAGFVAYDEAGAPIPGWPRPGGAGVSPSLWDLDGDGATEVAAGAPFSDSLAIYAYDAGAGTWAPGYASWPTVRGDDRRSASFGGPRAPAIFDRIRPARIGDLVASAITTTSAMVRWTDPGDDSLAGTARQTDLWYAGFPLTETNLVNAVRLGAGLPGAPGSPDSLLVAGLQEGREYWFAARATDAAGNPGALSNADTVRTAGQPPARIADLRVSAIDDTTVMLAWTATGDDGTIGRPASYLVAGSPAGIDSAVFDAAPRLLSQAASVDPGATETARVGGLERGRRWSFAVMAVDRSGTRGAFSNVADAVIRMGGAIRGRAGVLVAVRGQPARSPVAIDWQGTGSAGPGGQSLTLYDLGGRALRHVALGGEPGGSWNWDGRDDASRAVPAGLYFVRLVSGPRHAQANVVLLR